MKKLSTRFEVSASNFWVRNVKTSEVGQKCQSRLLVDTHIVLYIIIFIFHYNYSSKLAMANLGKSTFLKQKRIIGESKPPYVKKLVLNPGRKGSRIVKRDWTDMFMTFFGSPFC
jgi:hypothetical protein